MADALQHYLRVTQGSVLGVAVAALDKHGSLDAALEAFFGVAMHVGQDGSGNARELEQNVENFCKKPVEWVVGPDRCASTASAPRSSRTTRSPSRAHTRRGGVSPQLQCMIKGDETRGVVACAYDTDLLVQSHGLQNLAFARARPASAASCSSASASASTSASASASASEFEKGLHAVIDDIIKDAVSKGYHYPAEPLCRSRNLEAIKRRAALPTRIAILLVGEGMNRAHHDLLDEQCPSGRAMNKVID